MKKESRAPLIVAVALLLLPLLYVGSYFALVVPAGRLESTRPTPKPGELLISAHWGTVIRHYRWGGKWSEGIFWPLEKIDRKVRPEVWDTLMILELGGFKPQR